jgi:Protein of unknown function (DUF3086)
MPNRQPPNDPNLERDLWGDDDRPMIDLQRKQRDDRAEVSQWEDEGETSNWDDVDDYGREYDEPNYGSGLTTPPTTTTPTFMRDVEAEASPGLDQPEVSESRYATAAIDPESNLSTAQIVDPDLSGTNLAEAVGDEPDSVADPNIQAQEIAASVQSSSAPETSSDTAIVEQPTPQEPVDASGSDMTTAESGLDLSTSAIAPQDARDLSLTSNSDLGTEADSSPVAFDQAEERSGAESEDDEPIYQADDAVTQTAQASDPTPPEGDGAITVNQQDASSYGICVDELEAQARNLRQEIAQLQAQKSQLQLDLSRLIQESLQDLKLRRQELQTSVEQLERRQARIQEEMQTTFAGASQDLAVRVQGFKEYLVGSLQDLSLAAERLKLAPDDSPRPRIAPRDPVEPARSPRTASPDPSRDRRNPPLAQPSLQTPRTARPDPAERPPLSRNDRPNDRPSDRPNDRLPERPGDRPTDPSFGKKGFQDQASFIRSTLDRYRDRPDYYGPPWQLRRTFQPVQAERVSDWFFNQSGRGVVRSMGSRLQNILIASTTISILRGIYDKRLRTLVLANSPERLGEWRRGLQDCLGITRNDFGPDRGITLFEDPMLMAQKAERLVKAGWLPLIVMDESEAQLNLSLLQFPLWLAFAADPSRSQSFDRDWLVR